MKYNKGFLGLGLILAIIAVLVVGGGAYYLGTKNESVPKNAEENNSSQENQSQNKLGSTTTNNLSGVIDETSNWKTYKHNDGIKWEIKFPSTWESPYRGWGGADLTAGISTEDNNNACVIDVSSSLSDDAEITNLLGKGYIKTSIIIDGIDGIRLTANPPHEGLVEAVYFKTSDNSFRIARNKNSGNVIEQDCIKNFNLILNTFKFVK